MVVYQRGVEIYVFGRFFLGLFWNISSDQNNVVSRGILFPTYIQALCHKPWNKYGSRNPNQWVFQSKQGFCFRCSYVVTEPLTKVCLKLKKTKWTPQQLLGCRARLNKTYQKIHPGSLGGAPGTQMTLVFDWSFRPSFGGLTFKNRGHLGSIVIGIYIYMDFLALQSSQSTSVFGYDWMCFGNLLK